MRLGGVGALAVCLVAVGCDLVAGLDDRGLATCQPEALRCEAGLRQRCNADGRGWTTDRCPGETPYCTGDGSCARCQHEGQRMPDDSLGDCRVPVCRGGRPISEPDDGDVADPDFDCARSFCKRGQLIREPQDSDLLPDADPCTLDRCEGGFHIVEPTTPAFTLCSMAEGVGYASSCARTSEGYLVCWGNNFYGQLGTGITDFVAHPAPVLIAALPPVIGASVGGGHVLAWTVDGTLYGWGRNQFGEARAVLGDALLPGPLFLPGLVRKAAAGNLHSCAIFNDATLHCWGDNTYGQLGDGSTSGRPNPMPFVDPRHPDRALADVIDVRAGAFVTCAITADRALYCAGASGYAGNGSPLGAPPVALPNVVLEGVSSVSLAYEHSCAVGDDGQAWCWGSNYYGESGDPATLFGFLTVPRRVAGTPALQVTSAYRHTCARTPLGVSCWGANHYGYLGQGDGCAAGCSTYSVTPLTVVDLTAQDEVASYWTHTCARRGASVRCWGYNDYGQLGDGTTAHADRPMPLVWPPPAPEKPEPEKP
jgi:hypothetical protein